MTDQELIDQLHKVTRPSIQYDIVNNNTCTIIGPYSTYEEAEANAQSWHNGNWSARMTIYWTDEQVLMIQASERLKELIGKT